MAVVNRRVQRSPLSVILVGYVIAVLQQALNEACVTTICRPDQLGPPWPLEVARVYVCDSELVDASFEQGSETVVRAEERVKVRNREVVSDEEDKFVREAEKGEEYG